MIIERRVFNEGEWKIDESSIMILIEWIKLYN